MAPSVMASRGDAQMNTTLEDVEQLLRRSRPASGPWRGTTVALLGLSMLLGAWLADPALVPAAPEYRWMLPHLVLGCMAAVMLVRMARQRRLAERLRRAFEAVRIEDWPAGEADLVRALSTPVAPPAVRTEALLALAAVAEAGRRPEIAARLYETVLEQRAGEPLQLHAARVALATLLLRQGQITDAVNMIDRLDRSELPEALRAGVEMLVLLRELTLGHSGEALDRAPRRRALFRRHLGTRAGYGYALLAAAFDRAGRQDEAQRFWHDATMLLRPAALTARFEELAPLARRYPAAERPI